ncbi:MAG: nucleotidyltransferase family protein [Clostridia bacterium]|nr:nucleotidyltransferase family protein [Clostridia bacterium]
MTKDALYDRFMTYMAAVVNGSQAEPLSTTAEEWGLLYKLALRQSLSGALYVCAEGAPEPVTARLKRDAYQTMVKSTAQQEAQQAITEAFSAREVPHLYVKGAAIRRLWPKPELRSMGDIDLLVKEQSLPLAEAAMQELGFERLGREADTISYQKDLCLVEIHVSLKLYDRQKAESVRYDDVWEDARLQSGSLYRLTDEAQAMKVISHLAAHFVEGGCGIRQVMDVAVLCRAFPDPAFWNAVLARLQPYGIREFAGRLLFLCGNWFGVPVPEGAAVPVEPATAKEMQRRLLENGTFGADEKLALSQMRRRAQSGQSYWKRWLFPSTAYLQKRYPYAAKYPILLPVAFGERMIDGVFKNRRTHKARLQYAEQHKAELMQEIAFFDAIGL